jgi:divalent metal cation (Fe/Co/Zn/Cd) transporter
MCEQVIKVEGLNRSELVTRGRKLEYITIAWNTLEGVVAVVAGIIAGSIALIGFGFDSLIEVASGGALMWRLRPSRNPLRASPDEPSPRYSH